MYIPAFFKPFELVSQADFNDLAGKEQVWRLFDSRILRAADLLRMRYGRLVCNTWWWGGKNQHRGIRTRRCRVGSWTSQHRFGRALDLIPTDATVDEIRKDLTVRPEVAGNLITAIEADVDWLHIDCRNHSLQGRGMFVFNP